MKQHSERNRKSTQIQIKNIENPFIADFLAIHYSDVITILLDIPDGLHQNKVTFSGHIDGGLDLKWDNVTLADVWIRFEPVENTTDSILITDLGGTLSIGQTQVTFEPRPIEQLDFFHFSVPQGVGVELISELENLLGDAESIALLEKLKWFSPAEDFALDLVLRARNGQPFVDLFVQTEGGTREFGAFGVNLKEDLVGVSVTRRIQDQSTAIIGTGVVSIGEVDLKHESGISTLGFRLQLIEDEVSLSLDIAADTQLSLNDFLLSGNLAKLEDWNNFVKLFPFMNQIQFEALDVRCSKDLKQIKDARIRGFLVLDQDILEVTFDYPTMEISLNYISNTGMDAGDLVQLSNNDQALFHGKTTISRLGVNCTLSSGEFSGGIGLATDWTFRFGRTPVQIRNIDFDVTKSTGSLELLASGVMTIGDLDVRLMAMKDLNDGKSGWDFSTEIAHDHPIELRHLIDDLADLFHFSVPDFIPALSVSRLHMAFNTESHDFGLSLIVQLEKPGLGPFTEGDLFVEINLTKNANGSHDFAMNLSGFITIKGTEFDVSAENIGRTNWAIDLVWDKQGTDGIDLTAIMQFFAGEDYQPHNDFHKLKDHLLIEHVEFHYQHGDEKTSTDTSFLMDLKIRVGDNEFEGLFSGVKTLSTNKWHFLVGIGYDHMDNIPGSLFDAKKMTDFTVKNAWMMVNTSAEEIGHWPPLPTSIPSVVAQQQLKPGLVLLAEMDISQQKHVPGASKVFEGHEHTDVVVLAEIGTSGLLLEAILEGNLQIPTGQGHHLDMKNVSLTINLGTNNSLKLVGTFDLDVDDHQQHLTVALAVDETGIVLIVDDNFDDNTSNDDQRRVNTEGWHPFGLKGLNIDELAFELGIDFIPPGVRIGFEGKMHLDGEKPGDDLIAIVLEFSEPIPNPEYLAIAFKSIKFSDIVDLFPGSSSKGHQHISDNLAEIDEFGLVWCEKPIVLPDGTNGRVGFSLHGTVKILNWGAYFSLEVHPETGIQGAGEMAPIHVGPLRITGKGTGVAIKQEFVDGDWKNVSNVMVNPKKESTKELKANPTRMYQLVEPGGVSIQFSSTTSPYLRMSADVQLFGMNLADIDIDIEDDSAKFDLFFQIPLIAKFKVASYLKKNHDFRFSGDFFLGLDLNITIPFVFGPIHIHVRIGFDVSMVITKEKNAIDLELEGSFKLMGKDLSLGKLEIKGIPTSLKELPTWILDKIEGKPVPDFSNNMVDGSGGNNQDDYSKKREQLATELLEKAEKWAQFVHDDIEQLQKEGVLSETKMNALAAKIDEDTQRIKTEGKAHADSIQLAGNTEETHLNKLSDLAKKQPKDSNQWRADEMKRMQWEIDWLKDDSEELRKKLLDLWQTLNGDEEKVMKEAEKMITTDPNSKTLYPRRAVEHHLKILTIHQQAHSLEHEVLQRGRTHAQAILNHVNHERFSPIKNTGEL